MTVFQWWIAAVVVGSVLAADPSCETGLISGSICCTKSCGHCGGPGCGKLPGGAQDCCSDPIEQSGRHCATADPPCNLTPPPTPPVPHPSSAILSLGGMTGRVDPKFVSFTMDSSSVFHIDLNGKNSANGSYGGTLDVLSQGLYPAHLRVGGTQGDYDIYTGFSGAFPIGEACSHLHPPMTDYRCAEVTPSQISTLLKFVQRNNLTLVYGLNDLYGRPTKTSPEKEMCNDKGDCPMRNTTNYESLLHWIATAKPTGFDHIYAFELGNELNSCLNDVDAQAQDFGALHTNVVNVWSTLPSTPKLVGPDTHSAAEFQTEGVTWFAKFVKSAATVVDHYTFHMYSLGNGPKLDPVKLDASYLSQESLDKCGEGVRALQSKLEFSQRSSLWAGETAAANQGGQSGITDTYIDGFWYLDQLGQFAALNVSVFLRQTMISGSGYPLVETTAGTDPKPLPDYYIALLHKRLMGTTVLEITSDAVDIRVYAHCGVGNKGVTLAFLNIALATNVSITLPPALAAAPTRVEYMLTAGAPIPGAKSPLQSRDVKLNGRTLALVPASNPDDPPSLPDTSGKVVPQSTTVGDAVTLVFSTASYGFLQFPDAVVAGCE
eukprot:m.74242 g.74242  ORF g.74242 m.74242 type:complete len:604 (+) comp24640_c0_seq2:80-1891(+)